MTPKPTLTAIVTGASSGIGQQTALQLVAAGWNVALVARTPENLQATIDESANPTHCLPISADIANPTDITKIINQTIATFTRIDALANIAGYAPMMPIEKITPQIAQACVDVNLTATVNLTAAAWPTMVAQNAGVIVNVSSIASFDPFPGLSIYAAAKIGINLFTKCTADEGALYNIRAVAIAPGAVETPMLRSLFDKETFPTDKTLAPAEVAQLIVDCITARNKYTSGETIQLPNP